MSQTIEKMPPRIEGNPTTLSLLKMGCSVTTPDGYRLAGEPDTKYISLSHEVYGRLGLFDLSPRGLADTFADIRTSQRAHAKGEPL